MKLLLAFIAAMAFGTANADMVNEEQTYCAVRQDIASKYVYARDNGIEYSDALKQARAAAESSGQPVGQVEISLAVVRFYYRTGSDDVGIVYDACMKNHWAYVK